MHEEGLCRKVAFWRQNSKMGSRKINDLGASTFLFSVICDRAHSRPRKRVTMITDTAKKRRFRVG